MADTVLGIREYYDRTAREWADQWYADDAMLPLLRRFMGLLPPSPRMLDLCCGAGYESARLARLGARVVGLDLSGVSITIAREKNPELTFYEGDMLGDYAWIGRVDAVVCIAGLVHLQTAQLRTAFARMAEVLIPGGRALLVVRDGTGRQAKQSDVMIDGVRYDRSFHAHTLEELQAAASGLMLFEQEFPDPEPSLWRNYVFVKPESEV